MLSPYPKSHKYDIKHYTKGIQNKTSFVTNKFVVSNFIDIAEIRHNKTANTQVHNLTSVCACVVQA